MKNLIVVDVQKGFMTRPIYLDLAKKIGEFLDKNKENYSKIFFTKFVNSKNSLYETRLNWTNLQDEKSQEFAVDLPENAVVFKSMVMA